MPTESNDPRKTRADFVRYSGMAFEMLAIIGGGIWGATLLDDYFQWSQPWFTIILSPLSVIIALIVVLKDLKRP